MAESVTLARPYAKAAFHYALNQTAALDNWLTQLVLLGQLVSQDKIRNFLVDPAYNQQQHGEALLAICADQLDSGQQNFVKLLAAGKRLLLLPQIAQLFAEFKADYEQTMDVEVTSAFALTKTQEKTLTQILTKRFKRAVSLVVRIDRTLLGGVIIKANDKVLDGSVRGKLKQLGEVLAA